MLPIPGADSPGVLGALDFLRDANWKGETGVSGKRVVVIGGGNVAVDVARCALRTGATEVRLASLGERGRAARASVGDRGGARRGRHRDVLAGARRGARRGRPGHGHADARVPVRLRRDRPLRPASMGEGTTDLPGDVVVFAIGQASDLTDVVTGTDVALNERGNLVVDGSLFTTSIAGRLRLRRGRDGSRLCHRFDRDRARGGHVDPPLPVRRGPVRRTASRGPSRSTTSARPRRSTASRRTAGACPCRWRSPPSA